MAEKLPTHKKEIVRNPYTERLLAVCYELVKRRALRTKTDFSKAIGFNYLSQYNQLEKREANFPESKQGTAEAQLLSLYGVNPRYLQGNDQQMFIREPEPVKQAVGEGAVKLNFRDKREKELLLEELAACQRRVAELELKINPLAQAAEPSNPYNPDNNPDKTGEQ